MADTKNVVDEEGGASKPSEGGKKSNSVKQAKRLSEFKERIKDILTPEYDDIYLSKWLRAQQFDVKKTEKMLRDSLAYRERMELDTILENYTPPEVLQKYYPGGVCGYDHDGRPLRVEPFGQIDLKGLMYSAKRTDLEKTKLQRCEKIVDEWRKQSEKLGKRVDGVTVIFDMDGVGFDILWRPGLMLYLHLVKIMEDNYPEMVTRMFVINAPKIFPLIYKICRPLLSEDMKNRIHVLAGNYMKTILKFVDFDQMPAYLGGGKTDPDGNPRCVTMIGPGGKVPQTLYLTDQDMTENMETAVIPKAEKLYLPYDVDEAGHIIRWEFKTENHDISFGIWRVEEKGIKVKVVDMERYNSHIMTEDGSHIVDRPGRYLVCFDNSFSWTRSKKIWYCIEILTNEVDEDTKPDLEKLIQEEDQSILMERFET